MTASLVVIARTYTISLPRRVKASVRDLSKRFMFAPTNRRHSSNSIAAIPNTVFGRYNKSLSALPPLALDRCGGR